MSNRLFQGIVHQMIDVIDRTFGVIDETGTGDGALSVLAARWGLEHDEDNLMALVLTPEHLELRKRDEPKLGGIFVDFVGGAMAHRRKFGGGRGEAVAKAVGIKGDYLPDVVDSQKGLCNLGISRVLPM